MPKGRHLDQHPSLDWRILIVFGTDGNRYHYGPFLGYENAKRFAKEECNGFHVEVERLLVVERDYNVQSGEEV